jgi:Metallo-peptidase family M12B Reprolysin-like/Bacterial pre-peptidase C-terminal domain/Secretion system C-terminal sorting domain/Fibronectin type III domain
MGKKSRLNFEAVFLVFYKITQNWRVVLFLQQKDKNNVLKCSAIVVLLLVAIVNFSILGCHFFKPKSKIKMRKLLTGFALMLMLYTTVHAQNGQYWVANMESRSAIITDKAVARLSYPKEFKLFNLNAAPLMQQLMSVVDGRTAKQSTIITLPNAAGEMEQFEVYEASNFEPALQARFPEIRAYSGKGITDRYATVKLSISPQGIQSMVLRTDKDNEFIEPYSRNHTVYSVYNSHREKGNLPWTCGTAEGKMASDLNAQVANAVGARISEGRVRTMRLAQSVTAEYSNYFGATSASQVNLVLAAINNTLTRCNGVYERDLALHLNLINNTTSLIYYNTATDPYSPANIGLSTISGCTSPNFDCPGTWNTQLQSTLTSVIGEANYDIGHLFGASGGGGNAGCIGCVCNALRTSNSTPTYQRGKGEGITSPADGIPQGDNFDIDYVAHEVGHQLGANHTFSHNLEGTGVNKEVGSGITIMGYAGITNQDVANHSIDIFHQASINQMQNNLAGKTCPVSVNMTANTAPVVAAVGNFTIPISTPFALTGSATDAQGDPLTYCWEQNDNSTVSGTSSVASPTKASGPNWLTFPATASGTRLFPRLATILAGLNVTGPLTGGDAGANTEALSSVSRTLNFTLTVRDNHPYVAGAEVGQTATTDAVVTVSNTSGPFAVTAPNTAVTWGAGTAQTVTWSVNNTTAAPVSCANVKISLSTDGGNTFPTVLVASTPNDGTEAITVPTVNSTTCRIKVEAVGNIFFDIGNANFTINGTPPACGDASGLNAGSITTTGATVSWSAVSTAISYDVDYKAASSATWINAVTATTATSVALSGLTQGTLYDWRVRATCSGGSGNFVAAQFTTTTPATCNAPTGLSSSAITSSGATVSWTAVSGAANYDVDYKAASSGTWINAVTATTTTSRAISGLAASTLYDWRVRANCTAVSLTSSYTQAQFTTAAVSTCPGTLDVSTNGTASGAATIPFNTDVKGLISPSGDNDYYRFVITTGGTATITLTTLPADYDIRLYSSNGTTQLAISQAGGTTSETITRTYTAGTYFVRVYGYQNANNATQCYTLKVQLGTAARESQLFTPKADVVSIYPNPVRSELKVNMGTYTEPVTATVTDVYGRRMLNKTFANAASISMAKLASGVYMVTIVDLKGTVIKQDKIIKE